MRAVSGFDATFSAPKSLSVWWVLTGDRRLLAAHDVAVTAAEDVGAAARHYKDGFDQSDDPLIRGIRDGLGGIVDGVGQAATNAAESVGRRISEWRRSSKGNE